MKYFLKWGSLQILLHNLDFNIELEIDGETVETVSDFIFWDVFLELSCFVHDPVDVGNLISGFSAFFKSLLNIWKFTVHVNLENFEHYFTSV